MIYKKEMIENNLWMDFRGFILNNYDVNHEKKLDV